MLASREALIAAGVILVLALPAAAPAQEVAEKDLAAQIERLEKGQKEIRGELQQIRALIQQRQAPAAPARPAAPNVAGKTFELGDNPVKGARDARLVLVEFTDYQ